MKVSQDGFDVLTCDPKDLVMSSSFNLLKTKAVTTLNNAGTYNHGLGYSPLFFATRTINNDASKRSLIGDTTNHSAFSISLCYDNSTQVVNQTGDNGVQFYIFYNQ